MALRASRAEVSNSVDLMCSGGPLASCPNAELSQKLSGLWGGGEALPTGCSPVSGML